MLPDSSIRFNNEMWRYRGSTPRNPCVRHMVVECRWRRLLKAMVALRAAQAESCQHS